jgi:2Fe-2S ferredoxin
VKNSADLDATYHYLYAPGSHSIVEVRNGLDAVLKQYVWSGASGGYVDEIVQTTVSEDPIGDPTMTDRAVDHLSIAYNSEVARRMGRSDAASERVIMHMRADGKVLGPEVVTVRFKLEDPEPLTGKHEKEVEVKMALGESILEAALDHGINIEHACGGVCACSTCHVYLEAGEELFNEAEDDELDRVDEAPGVQINSRLSCQCVLQKEGGPVTVTVPSWNRNAVKEVPH